MTAHKEDGVWSHILQGTLDSKRDGYCEVTSLFFMFSKLGRAQIPSFTLHINTSSNFHDETSIQGFELPNPLFVPTSLMVNQVHRTSRRSRLDGWRIARSHQSHPSRLAFSLTIYFLAMQCTLAGREPCAMRHASTSMRHIHVLPPTDTFSLVTKWLKTKG